MLAKYFKPFLFFVIVPFILQLIIKFLYYTNRRVWILSKDIKDEPSIYIFWHGELLMQPFFERKIAPTSQVSMINSIHRDGNIMVKTMRYFNLKSIRGSSHRGGVKALIDSLKHIKNGGSMAITPDGPKGPRHSIKNGVVTLSQKGDIPIVTQHVVPTKYWRLKTWDQMIIPKPFGTLTYIAQSPFKVTGLSMEEAKQKVKRQLMKNSI